MRVLVIEDHPKMRSNVRAFLRLAKIDSDEAVTGKEGLELARSHPYCAIVLDLNMPVMDGRTFLKELRSAGNATPVIALTSDSLLSDKVETLGLGADDYLTKPFEHEELIARIRALSRRGDKPLESRVAFGKIEADYERMRVSKDGKHVALTAKEWGLFEFLSKNAWVPKNKTEILDAVWGESEDALAFDSVTLEAHVSSLRKKLGKSCITTIRNVGYVFE